MTNPIVAHARSMVGVKWRHRGRKPWAVDCIGLVVLSLRASGLQVNDRTNYTLEPWGENLSGLARSVFGDPVTDWAPGDIAIMRLKGMPSASHAGIIGDGKNGDLTLIHCYNGRSVTEHSMTQKWKDSITEVYRPWRK